MLPRYSTFPVLLMFTSHLHGEAIGHIHSYFGSRANESAIQNVNFTEVSAISRLESFALCASYFKFQRLVFFDGKIERVYDPLRQQHVEKYRLKCAMTPGYRSFKAGKLKFNIKTHPTLESWDAALRVCQSEGGSLVKIDTEEKEDVIRKNLGNGGYWTGVRYSYESHEFLWIDMSPFTLKNWARKEETLESWGSEDETLQTWSSEHESGSYGSIYSDVARHDCVQMSVYSGALIWQQTQCEGGFRFICEVLETSP